MAEQTIKLKLEEPVRGESAYEVAVRNGYLGTEEEWLASLKGEKGDMPDVSNKEDITNKVISIGAGSTHEQYSSARAVYDFVTEKIDELQENIAQTEYNLQTLSEKVDTDNETQNKSIGSLELQQALLLERVDLLENSLAGVEEALEAI